MRAAPRTKLVPFERGDNLRSNYTNLAVSIGHLRTPRFREKFYVSQGGHRRAPDSLIMQFSAIKTFLIRKVLHLNRYFNDHFLLSGESLFTEQVRSIK